MRFSTTDGKAWDVSDQCAFCDMDTGGNHKLNCPCHPIAEQGWEDIEQGRYKPLIKISAVGKGHYFKCPACGDVIRGEIEHWLIFPDFSKEL